MSKNRIPHGIYRHHKGDLYMVLGLSRESTNRHGRDGTVRVDYVSINALPDDEFEGRHSRELDEFTETVTWPDGKQRPRFELIRSFAVEEAEWALIGVSERGLLATLQEAAHLRAQRDELQARNAAYHDQVVELKKPLSEAVAPIVMMLSRFLDEAKIEHVQDTAEVIAKGADLIRSVLSDGLALFDRVKVAEKLIRAVAVPLRYKAPEQCKVTITPGWLAKAEEFLGPDDVATVAGKEG